MQFESQDKNYIIEFSKKEFSLFKQELNNKYESAMCKMDFKTNLGTVLKSIVISDIDMGNLLDVLYNFIETSQDTMISFKASSLPIVITTFRFSLVYNEFDVEYMGIFNQRILFEYYETIDDRLNLIFKIDMTDNIDKFAECIYYQCINDLLIENKELLVPDFIM